MRLKSLFHTLAILAAFAPVTAHALTCGHFNPGEAINRLIDQGKTPVVMVAMALEQKRTGPSVFLDLTTPAPSKRPVKTSTYSFVGTEFRPDGTERQAVVTVEVTHECFYRECGALPRRGHANLLILWKEGETLKTLSGPCGGGILEVPTSKQRTALKRCVASGRCSDADIKALTIRRR